MFGCCVAGRLLQTNLQQIDETHALFEIPAVEKVNHVCVFLLGTVPFPEGYGATVHFFWPGKGSQVLGMLSNEKPSAIFRLRSTFSSAPLSGMSTPSAFTSAASGSGSAATGSMGVTATLGFAVESLETVAAQMAALPTASVNATLGADAASAAVLKSVQVQLDPVVLAERIARHLVNYVSGFVPAGVGPETVIPMGIVTRWYESFMGKLRAGGTTFLEKEE